MRFPIKIKNNVNNLEQKNAHLLEEDRKERIQTQVMDTVMKGILDIPLNNSDKKMLKLIDQNLDKFILEILMHKSYSENSNSRKKDL